jgi:hypothetical protein
VETRRNPKPYWPLSRLVDADQILVCADEGNLSCTDRMEAITFSFLRSTNWKMIKKDFSPLLNLIFTNISNFGLIMEMQTVLF